MAEIIRNRTIRPSSRLEKSKSYKIETKQISSGDTLVVNIDHETKSIRKTYQFRGRDVAKKDSISFRVNDFGTSIEITWSGVQPIQTAWENSGTTVKSPIVNYKTEKISASKGSIEIKRSFNPISDTRTRVLILGTMPGNKSLELNEYYGHSRNRFWKIISAITNNNLPSTYTDKISLLIKTKIGIWDVVSVANRKGSLDNAIQNEKPNDLNDFISKNKNLKIIGFNGTKAEALFYKYFTERAGIKYISLPSTSPANTNIDFDNICNLWRQILLN